jgi:hypothetical protein
MKSSVVILRPPAGRQACSGNPDAVPSKEGNHINELDSRLHGKPWIPHHPSSVAVLLRRTGVRNDNGNPVARLQGIFTSRYSIYKKIYEYIKKVIFISLQRDRIFKNIKKPISKETGFLIDQILYLHS